MPLSTLRVLLSVLWLVPLGTGCAGALGAEPHAGETSRAMVVSAHPLATDAGVAVLAAGGTVVDASVAVSLALSVVEPFSSGIGGGGFMLVHRDGQTTSWDFRETAPAAATRDMFVKDGEVVEGASTLSASAAAIPGQVRGLAEVHRRYGKLPWTDLVEPAIRLAREGFAVSPRLRQAIKRTRKDMNSAARSIFLAADGSVPAVGSILKQPDLARTLEAIARTRGEAFYTGGVAREMVRAVRAEGGIWTQQDLASYRVVPRPTVAGEFRGYRVVSMGPPSSGGLLLVQMLGVLDRFERHPDSFASAAGVHRLVETMKRAFAMRAVGLGDPDHARVDRPAFIGKPVIERLAKEVAAAKRATPYQEIGRIKVVPRERTHTSHFSVMTEAGDAVACTQTINLWFGNGRVAGSTGVVLNNEMDDFSARPGVPNAFGLVGSEANSVAPGKRPLSSMTPALVLEKGRVVGAFGSPGGSRIITTVLQTILNVIEHRMSPQRATAAPRLHHQWFPDELWLEPGRLEPAVVKELEALGHRTRPAPIPIGNSSTLWRDADGALSGAADPRGEGVANVSERLTLRRKVSKVRAAR